MNLIWHITRKDLRRFWVPVALVCVVTLLRFGVGHALLRADAPEAEWFVRMGLYSDVLRGLVLVVVYLLAAAVVQADSLAGAAFWQTRPISRIRLLSAKALGLGLMFGVLPVLVALPWWLACGFGAREVVPAAAGVLGVQAGVVLLALPWAVVTDSFARFLLYSLVAAVAGITCFFDLAANVPGAQPVSDGAGATRLLLMIAVAAMVSLGVAIHQFATRRTWRSIVLIVGGGLALLATACWSKWDASRLWEPRRLPPAGLARDVKVSFHEARLYPTGAAEKLAYGAVDVGLDGVPAGYGVIGLNSDQLVRWPDGRTYRQVRNNVWGSPSWSGDAGALLGIKPAPRPTDPDWLRTSQRILVRPAPTAPASAPGLSESFFFGLGGELGDRITTQPSTLEGSYWFGLVQSHVVGERPLEVGAEFGSGPRHTRVAGIMQAPAGSLLRLALVERAPSLALRKFDPSYAFVDGNRTSVLEGLNEIRLRTIVEGVEITLRHDIFRARSGWDGRRHQWVPVAEDFDRGTLVELQTHLVQRFNRDLTVPGFLMKPAFTGPAVPESLGAVTVAGAVNHPATIDARRGDTVLEALRNVGGFTDAADVGNVMLIRIGDDGLPVRTILDVGAYLEGRAAPKEFPALRAGDFIQVSERKLP